MRSQRHTTMSPALWSAILMLIQIAACGDSGSSGGAGAGGGGGDGATGGTTTDPGAGGAAAGGEGGGGSSSCDAGCDDGHSCTLDSCTNDVCQHVVGPDEGETACPNGTYCSLSDGCVSAPACATNADCERLWSGDACKADIACELETSLCTFNVLDKDGDGHPPPVCGGDDCNDDDGDTYPGALEDCDGEDQDCDPLNELESSCATPYFICQDLDPVQCGCDPAEVVCPGTCGPIDFTTNNTHCGDCATVCPSGTSCSSGDCECNNPALDLCNGSCLNFQNDESHCGDCTTTCTANATCVNGDCVCAAGLEECGGTCVNTNTSEVHCGGCNSPCAGPTPTCSNGACTDECDPPCSFDEYCEDGMCWGEPVCGNDCGNGVVEPDPGTGCHEECDDGNEVDGDGCSALCLFE